MQFSVTKDNLQKGLAVVSHVSSKQVNLPVLQNVHIKAEGGSIVLSTTNLELAVRVQLRGKIDQPGEYTVPSKLFYDFVTLLPSDRVDVECLGTTLDVSCGETATSINGIEASEFPLIPSAETTRTLSLPGSLFREGLMQVQFAVSTSEARPELSGVYVQFQKDQVILAATDSYRLAERVLHCAGLQEEKNVILPAQTISEVLRMLSVLKDDPEVEDTLTIRFSENQIVFQYGFVELISRTIDGTYPDYRQIIPSVFKTEAIVGREELIQALKTASLFSRQGIFDVTMKVLASEQKVQVMATEATRGKNTASCPADVKGDENGMAVNFRYVLDGLNATKSEGVTVKLIDALNPCIIMPNGELEKGAYTYIVMPIRS